MGDKLMILHRGPHVLVAQTMAGDFDSVVLPVGRRAEFRNSQDHRYDG